MSLTSTHTRHVHHVHLHAASQDLIWRGQRLLEDALHTASLPAATTSQLLFIRHLNVGTIHSDQSPMSLSLTLEKQIQQLSAIATPGTQAIADQAAVVSFPDDLTAYSHFAHCLCTGQSSSAWFWPRLLPTWQPALSPSESVHSLLSHLATHPLAPFATATVLQYLHRQGSLASFLSILQPEDGPQLLAQNGWSASFEVISGVIKAIKRPSLSEAIPAEEFAITGFLSALTRPWPLEDSRTFWLAAMCLIAVRPTLAKANNLMAIAQLAIQTFHPSILNSPRSITPSLNVDPALKTAAGDASFGATQPETVTKTSSPVLVTASSQPSDAASPRLLEAAQTPPSSGIHTDYAGLVYLLNLLEFLQLPVYLLQYDHPETFPQALLRYTAQRLGVPVEDPILTAVTPPLPTTPSSLLTAWYSALKTWTRRHTGLTLKSLIHRPGDLALTPTHLDLTFDLNEIDIRIRRAGLDLNPGWLPWFGRVVAIHYEPSRQQHSGSTQ